MLSNIKWVNFLKSDEFPKNGKKASYRVKKDLKSKPFLHCGLLEVKN
jgi:hypothetical protein